MSDIQELIHKTSMDCIEKGQAMERERIIKLLEKRFCIFEQNFRNCQCVVCRMTKWHIELIKGETK